VTSGPYRTSQTPDAENNAQPLTEEDNGKRNRVLPKVNLSPAEGDWLKIVSARFRQGVANNVVLLKKFLNQQGKWTKGFRPLSIDDRVLRNGNDPTLLGIWHADCDTDFIDKCDTLLQYLKQRLSFPSRTVLNTPCAANCEHNKSVDHSVGRTPR
jgi:hypothetical protein